LHDSGLTMTEASDILRAKAYTKSSAAVDHTSGFARNDTKPSEAAGLVAQLRDEIAFLRERVSFLESQVSSDGRLSGEASEWWQRLKGEIDGA